MPCDGLRNHPEDASRAQAATGGEGSVVVGGRKLGEITHVSRDVFCPAMVSLGGDCWFLEESFRSLNFGVGGQ